MGVHSQGFGTQGSAVDSRMKSTIRDTITMSTETLTQTDFKVKDINLADFGRKEIEIAQHEMPGLMATREKYADEQPLKGVRIMGSRT